MAIYYGTNKVSPSGITAVYFGSNQVFTADVDEAYFYIENINTSYIKVWWASTSSVSKLLKPSYSKDKINWTSAWSPSTKIQLDPGEKLYIKNSLANGWVTKAPSSSEKVVFHTENSSGSTVLLNNSINVGGHLTSLFDGGTKTDVMKGNLNYLFDGLHIIDAGKLVLPSDLSSSTYSFYYMFTNCKELVVPPQLPSFTGQSAHSLERMFYYCTALDVSASTGAHKFWDCTDATGTSYMFNVTKNPLTVAANTTYYYN